jgi:hypothetical protein
LEYFTLPAEFYLLPPVFLTLPLTKGPIDKPAELPSLKLPNSTIISPFNRTVYYIPTRPRILI